MFLCQSSDIGKLFCLFGDTKLFPCNCKCRSSMEKNGLFVIMVIELYVENDFVHYTIYVNLSWLESSNYEWNNWKVHSTSLKRRIQRKSQFNFFFVISQSQKMRFHVTSVLLRISLLMQFHDHTIQNSFKCLVGKFKTNMANEQEF